MRTSRFVRIVLAGVVLTVVVLAQVGLVLAPSQLGRNPLLILVLRPTPAFLLLVGDAVHPVVAVLVATVGRTAVDLAYFATARHGAAPVLQRFRVGRDLTDGMSRRAARRGLLTLSFFWSSSPVISAIGLGRTSAWTFLAVTGAGNLVTSTAYVLSGRQLSGVLAPVDAWLSTNGGWLTVALVGAVVVSALATTRVRRSP